MRNAYLIGLLLGISILILDSFTKWLTYSTIPPIETSFWEYPYGGVPVFRNFFGIEFSLVHATNRGAAWGAFAGHQTLLLLLRIALVVALTGYLVFWNRQRTYVIPICLLIAGAIGNIVDYFAYGVVVDMFKFVFWGYHYPVFNVADSAITIGIMWLIFASFTHQEAHERS